MSFFSVGYPETGRIHITLIASPPSAQWSKARVQINIDGFSGDVEIYMDTSDMARFKDELETMYNLVAGVSEFKTTENQLYIRLEMDNLGHVQASGFLVDNTATNRLTFGFTYDQTLLWHTISEIDEALFELGNNREKETPLTSN